MPTSFTIKSFTVGPLQTNCYFITDQTTTKTIVIDPGADGDFLSDELFRLKFTPFLIYFTHGHFDHVCGSLPIFLNFHPQAFLHHADLPLYRRAQTTAHHYTRIDTDPTIPPSQLLTNPHQCQTFINKNFPHAHAQLLEIPGHSPGLTALHFPQDKLLFSGDLIFTGGDIGRTDFAYSDPQAMTISLKKITKLPPTTHIFPGHEATFTLQDFHFPP